MASTIKQQIQNAEFQHRLVYGDIDTLTRQMANDVCLAVALEVDELNTNSHEFRSVIETTITRLLHHLEESNERIGIYEEALPGFTLLLLKKEDGKIIQTERPKTPTKKEPPHSEMYEVTSLMIQQFLKRTKRTIMSIEHQSVLIVLFPVSDTRKHLKALGLNGSL